MGRLAILLSLVALFSAPASAREPTTRMGAVVGGRAHSGQAGEDYAFGYLVGAEAGWQPALLGVSWRVLFGEFDATNVDVPDDTLAVLEMSFSVRGRFPLSSAEAATFAYVLAGVDLLRTSTPLAPQDSRTFFGPSAGLGLEIDIAEQYVISFGASYGLITGGPAGLTVLLSVGVGSGG